nr:membrane protein BILF1 [Equid gammaherpesvirus 5]
MTDESMNYSFINYQLLLNGTLVANCTRGSDPEAAVWGTMLECVFLGIVVTMMGFFSVRTGFKPNSNIWLFAGCVVIGVWLVTKMAQDYAKGALKCVVTESLVTFCYLLGGLLNVGMCLDRCRAVYSRMAGGTMTPAAICAYIGAAGVACLTVTAVNAWEISRNGLHKSPNLAGGCFLAATPEAHRAKLLVRVLVYFSFVCAVTAATALTLKKILSTSLKGKWSICANVVLVTLPISFIWLTAITSAWLEYSSGVMCPRRVTGNVFIYLSSVPMLIILFVYMFTGKNLRHTFNNSTGSRSSSSASVSCFLHLAGRP